MNTQAARNIYSLLKNLKAKQVELRKQAESLNNVLLLPEITAYDEQQANKRISNAMINDSVTGDTTVDMVKSIIAKERAEILKKSEELAKSKATAKDEMLSIETALNDLESHIDEVTSRLNAEIRKVTNDQIEAIKQDYVDAAYAMFEKLITMYGLLSVIAPHKSNAFMTSKVFLPKGEDCLWKKPFRVEDHFYVSSFEHAEKMAAVKKQFLTELFGEEKYYEIRP